MHWFNPLLLQPEPRSMSFPQILFTLAKSFCLQEKSVKIGKNLFVLKKNRMLEKWNAPRPEQAGGWVWSPVDAKSLECKRRWRWNCAFSVKRLNGRNRADLIESTTPYHDAQVMGPYQGAPKAREGKRLMSGSAEALLGIEPIPLDCSSCKVRGLQHCATAPTKSNSRRSGLLNYCDTSTWCKKNLTPQRQGSLTID